MSGGGRTPLADALADALRAAILDGALAPGRRLVERELVAEHGVARHTLRAALRSLAADGLVELRPGAGARVATPDPDAIAELFALRAALEVEAARIALARDAAGLAAALEAGVRGLREACAVPRPAWSAVAEAHAGLHRAIVGAAGRPRISVAHRALEAEMRLTLLAMRGTSFDPARMVEHHEALARELPRDGPEVLRAHLADGLRAVRGEDDPRAGGNATDRPQVGCDDDRVPDAAGARAAPAHGETDLPTLLRTLRPRRNPGGYVHVRVAGAVPAGATPVATVVEDEGLTLVLPRAQADALGLPYASVAAWITLQVHSALEAVGLTAAFSTALGEAGISANVVAGFAHDHLFVPEADADRALDVLRALAERS